MPWCLKSPAPRLFPPPFFGGAHKKKHQISALSAFVEGVHNWPVVRLPSQRVSNAESVSIWWRHMYLSNFVHQNWVAWHMQKIFIVPRLDLSGTPGLRPIGLSPGSWQTSLGLGSMSRYSALILICIIVVSIVHRLIHILHYNNVTMSVIASPITSNSTVYFNYLLSPTSKKHRSSALLALWRGFHWWPVNSPHKRSVTRKSLPFYDVINDLLSHS